MNQRFKKNSVQVSDFYKCKDQGKEFWYKIICYPLEFKSKKKVQSANFFYAANNYSGQSESVQAKFSYGINTDVRVSGGGEILIIKMILVELLLKFSIAINQLLRLKRMSSNYFRVVHTQRINVIIFLKCLSKDNETVTIVMLQILQVKHYMFMKIVECELKILVQQTIWFLTWICWLNVLYRNLMFLSICIFQIVVLFKWFMLVLVLYQLEV